MAIPSGVNNISSRGGVPVFPPLLRAIFRHCLHLDARVISGESLDEAKRLIYDIYYGEQKWVPPPGNPSELRYEHGRIQDNLDAVSTWIGVYQENSERNELAAVCRVVSEVEFQRYLPRNLQSSIPGERPRCEINRLAVRGDYRKRLTFPFVVFAPTVCAYRMGFRSSLVGCQPFLVKSLRWFGHITGFRFRYHPSDEEATVCLFPLTLQRIALLVFRISLWKIRRIVFSIIGKLKLHGFPTKMEEQPQGGTRSRL